MAIEKLTPPPDVQNGALLVRLWRVWKYWHDTRYEWTHAGWMYDGEEVFTPPRRVQRHPPPGVITRASMGWWDGYLPCWLMFPLFRLWAGLTGHHPDIMKDFFKSLEQAEQANKPRAKVLPLFSKAHPRQREYRERRP